MNYEVGDNVKVVKNFYLDGLGLAVKKYGGQTATITAITCGGNYKLDIDNGDWFWSERALEPIKEG